MSRMNNQGILPSLLVILFSGGVSAANIFEMLQPVVGFAIGICTLVGAVIIIKVNLQRLKNLKIENKLKQKQLDSAE